MGWRKSKSVEFLQTSRHFLSALATLGLKTMSLLYYDPRNHYIAQGGWEELTISEEFSESKLFKVVSSTVITAQHFSHLIG